jgi:ketosteroid isomerase-like protein
VELVKALIPQGTDIVPIFRDEDTWAQTREAVSRLITDDFESVMVFPAQTRTYAGLEGLRRNWLDWLEPWATYRTNFDELIDVGDRVVILLRDHGRRKDMDKEVELIGATILTFREGQVARWEDYADRAAALHAAGLAEDVHAS